MFFIFPFAVILLIITSCSIDYTKLAEEHKNYCIEHRGRNISIRRDNQWQIFCNDGTIVIKE